MKFWGDLFCVMDNHHKPHALWETHLTEGRHCSSIARWDKVFQRIIQDGLVDIQRLDSDSVYTATIMWALHLSEGQGCHPLFLGICLPHLCKSKMQSLNWSHQHHLGAWPCCTPDESGSALSRLSSWPACTFIWEAMTQSSALQGTSTHITKATTTISHSMFKWQQKI